MADRSISVALQLKLTQFTNGLRKAQQDVKKFGDDLSSQAKKNKGDWDTVGNTLGGIGLAAGVGLAAATLKFADFDKAMSNVKAATHETAGTMAELRQAALDAGRDTAFSATEAAAGIENLAKAGVTTKDILGGGLKGALDLAAAGELGVADAAEVAATAMTQFKLEGTDVPHIADLLSAAAGKAQGEVSDMAQALNQSGLVAAQMGLSIEETTGTLAAFASAGLLGSDAGTSFKTMLLQLANPSEKAAGTMKELGINAYDAQGAFVGIAPLAEQLKTKLSGLSEEQRNSALATIFGSDAIRAANVLYSNGAAGIDDWTTKVNDAGFAAETAAIKQDNLRGDLEKLGGSFETALIKMGEGADGPLRGITQGLSAVVDKFGELPAPVQQAGLALGGIAGAGGLAAAGALKAASAASEAREAWQALGTVGRRLTLSMGAVGIALTAAVVLYGAFSKRNEEAKQQADDLRSTLDDQTGAITGNTRAFVANDLAHSGLAQKAKDLGLNLSTVTDAALGNTSAMSQLVTQLDAIAAANSFLIDPRIGTQYTDQGQAAVDLKAKLIGLNGSLTDAQKTQKLAAEGASEHKDAQTLQAEAVAKANEKIQQETQSLDDLISKMHEASGEALSLSGAQISYQEALDKASEAADKNGRTIDRRTGKLNLDTEAGRANQSALDALAESTNTQTDAMLRNGRSNDEVRTTAESARKKFIDVAVQMGLNKTAAKNLADQYIDIPDKVDTNVTNNAAGKPKTDVANYTTALGLVPRAKTTGVTTKGIPTAKKDVTDFATHVDKTLGGIADEGINVAIKYSSTGVNLTTPSSVGRRASGGPGGPVNGPGTTTSDEAGLYALSNKEWVIKAKSSQKYGDHAMASVNDGTATIIPDGGFAAGGSPGLAFRASVPSTSLLAKEVASHMDSLAKPYIDRGAKQLASPSGPAGPPGSAQSFRGKRLNARTISMLLNAERILGAAFHITQGSYSTSVAASGGTHSGGGAMDTDGPRGWNTAVSALRQAGFAAWHRTPAQGPWGHHIHSIAMGDTSASASAKNQMAAYRRGGDGLGHGMAKGGPVKPLSFDNGGMLPTGPSFVYNGTGTPEPVGHDVVRKSDLAGMIGALTITNWDKGTGHFQLIARGEVAAAGEFAGTMTRMGG